MRAFLLATATMTNIGGLRASIRLSHQTNRIQGLLTGACHHAEPGRDLVTFRAPKALGDIDDVLGRLRGELVPGCEYRVPSVRAARNAQAAIAAVEPLPDRTQRDNALRHRRLLKLETAGYASVVTVNKRLRARLLCSE